MGMELLVGEYNIKEDWKEHTPGKELECKLLLILFSIVQIINK